MSIENRIAIARIAADLTGALIAEASTGAKNKTGIDQVPSLLAIYDAIHGHIEKSILEPVVAQE